MEPEEKGWKIAIPADMKNWAGCAQTHREIGEGYAAGHPVTRSCFCGLAAETGHGLGASASPVPVVSQKEELEQVGQWFMRNRWK